MCYIIFHHTLKAISLVKGSDDSGSQSVMDIISSKRLQHLTLSRMQQKSDEANASVSYGIIHSTLIIVHVDCWMCINLWQSYYFSPKIQRYPVDFTVNTHV